MAEFPVDIPELEVACDFFIESEYPYFEELREAFLVLKLCGCRPMEIFEIERWTHVNDFNFTLQPQKNNLVRSVTLGAGCESFRTCVINQISPFLGRTYSQIQGLFLKLCPWRPIFSGDREITLYIYRYYFVKSLIDSGLTYAQVAELMGHRTETPVYLYANAVLSSTYVIPVTPVDPLPVGHIDTVTVPISFTGAGSYLSIDFPVVSAAFTIHLTISNQVGSTIIPIGPYQYDKLERSIWMPFDVQALNTFARLYPVNSYTSPSNSGYTLLPTASIRKITFVIIESLFESGNYLTGTVTIKFYGNGLFQRQAVTAYTTYSKVRAAKLLVNGRRRSTGTYSSQTIFTLDNLYFWDRILSDAEILSLCSL